MSSVTPTAQEDHKTATPSQAPTPPQPSAMQLDDSQVAALYANLCRVTNTPEELIIDFGLNPQSFGTPAEPLRLSQRIVTNYYTAKRLLYALQMSIQRYEATFGVLEIDVQKRVQPNVRQQPAPAGGRT